MLLSYCIFSVFFLHSAECFLLASPPSPTLDRLQLLEGLRKRIGVSLKEKTMRARLLMKSQETVTEHNSKLNRAYNQKLNKFSLMTKEERKGYLGLQNETLEDSEEFNTPRLVMLGSTKTPSEFSHRDHNHVTYAKNQVNCGACWAFAAAGAFEGAYAMATGVLKSFSAKELLDCTYSSDPDKNPCTGGSAKKAYEYIGTSQRLASQNDIPYVAYAESCDKWEGKPNGIRNAEYTHFEKFRDEYDHEGIKMTIKSNTPSVTFMVEDDFYRFSVGHYEGCLGAIKKNHAIILVGYGADYWEGKNSWGSDWGDNGFVKFTRSWNVCGIVRLLISPKVNYIDKGEEDAAEIVPVHDLVNIAPGKTFITSDGVEAPEVVDDSDDTCSTTQVNRHAFFRVHLGKPERVQRIELLSDDPTTLLFTKAYVGDNGDKNDALINTVWEVSKEGRAVLRTSTTLLTGEYVFIYRYAWRGAALSLCDVKVFVEPEEEEEGEGECTNGTTLCPDGTCRHIHMC